MCNEYDLIFGNLYNNNKNDNLSTNNLSNTALNNLAKRRQTKISTSHTSITAMCLSAFDELNTKNNISRVPYAHNLYLK